jgi:hypothetical protein
MNTPIIFPFKECDRSDIADIKDYSLTINQSYNDHNDYWLPNPSKDIRAYTLIDTTYDAAEWDVFGNYITPKTPFTGDTFSYLNSLEYNRRYWVKLDIEITAGFYDLSIGGTTLTITTSSNDYTAVIGSGSSDDISITFDSTFEGKFYGINTYLVNEQLISVSDDDCSSFTDIIGSYHKNAINIQPFDTLTLTDKEYILSQKSLNGDNISNRISSAIPDNGFNYTSSDVSIVLGLDKITFGASGTASSNLTLTAGEFYRLSFTYTEAVQVNVGALILGNYDLDVGDSPYVELDFLAISGLLIFESSDAVITNVRLRTHQSNYSIQYNVSPHTQDNCETDNLVKLKWRNSSNVGSIPYCDFPFYFNECYFKGSVQNNLPEDTEFETYTDGKNNVITAYSNQYDIYELGTSEPYTPMSIFNMLSLASKQLFFEVNNNTYKAIEAVPQGDLSTNRKSVENVLLKLVKDNGNEITNCEC